MATCPMCDKPYNPDCDVQWFCQVCKIWHHISCLDNGGQRLPPGPETDAITTNIQLAGTWPYMDYFIKVLQKSIQQGKGGDIVGNGRLIGRAWEVYGKIQRAD
ncbi:hypothetical protein JVU11DRAFT_10120 [Chiua virens]|nr:hypothetical protein JVU11DRAFT_10120 [Chiua virens]